MSFYSGNTFGGGSYVFPKRNDAFVYGAHTDITSVERAFSEALGACDAVIVGAGAGLSTAAGLTYSGKRFEDNFEDFRRAYGITDMYSGGFYPFPDLETYWAWWSRHILINRFDVEVGKPYVDLLSMLQGKDYFVLTTNVDHQFQLAGFEEERLFYTQGDYGLLQCSKNCSNEACDNEALIREMVNAQENMRVPHELVPMCPHCGSPLIPNLRVDGSFCEPKGWYVAAKRYESFRKVHKRDRVMFLELGVGGNTPVIIKYPFWGAVGENREAVYVCVNRGEAQAPSAIADRSILVDGDIATFLQGA